MIIRELTGGIYFGEPRGVEKLNENNFRGFNTLVYTSEEIRRIASVHLKLHNQEVKNYVRLIKQTY